MKSLFSLGITLLIHLESFAFARAAFTVSNNHRILRSDSSSAGALTSPLFSVVKDKTKDDTEFQQHGGEEIATSNTIQHQLVNGDSKLNGSSPSLKTNDTSTSNPFANGDEYNLIDLAEEISNTIELQISNVTELVQDKLGPSVSEDIVSEVVTKLTLLANDLEKARRVEIERQVDEIERLLIRPLEDIAFNDAELYLKEKPSEGTTDTKTGMSEDVMDLVMGGANSTLVESSHRLRTAEIVRNINVAPLYYSVTLLLRWCRKISAPPGALLSFLKGMGSMIANGSNGRQSYDEFMKSADSMQKGWKRTGEIAAKGKWARKWAIMRRSAEIWAYFSSFYLKEKRILKLHETGRYSDARLSEERSKLGAEITQNLLKLGPTFIKVSHALVFF